MTLTVSRICIPDTSIVMEEYLTIIQWHGGFVSMCFFLNPPSLSHGFTDCWKCSLHSECLVLLYRPKEVKWKKRLLGSWEHATWQGILSRVTIILLCCVDCYCFIWQTMPVWNSMWHQSFMLPQLYIFLTYKQCFVRNVWLCVWFISHKITHALHVTGSLVIVAEPQAMLFYVVKLLPGKSCMLSKIHYFKWYQDPALSDDNFVPTCEVPTFSQVVIMRVDGKLGSKLKMWGQGRETIWSPKKLIFYP